MLRRERRIHTQIQMCVDAGIFGLSFWLAHYLRSEWRIGGSEPIFPFETYLWFYVIILPLVPILLTFHGFYKAHSLRIKAWQLFRVCTLVTISLILVNYLMRIYPAPARAVIVLFGPISFVLTFLKEELTRWGETSLGQAQSRKRVILLGTPEDTLRLRQEMREKAFAGMEILDCLNLNQTSEEQLVTALHQHSANGVILSATHTYFGLIERAIQVCEREGIESWLLADFFKTQISRTDFDDFYGRPMLVFRSTPEVSWQGLIKQMCDVILASLALVILAIPFLLVAILLKITSPGPILFRQKRSGLNGQPFVMLKFRSMVSDAEQRKQEIEALNEMAGPVFKVSKDPRITPVGRFLRKYSIDEFPQLINVLRGEMSLVGPRPLPVDEVSRFDDHAHRRRLSVKPGLTCLWQISGRNDVKDFRDWVRLDLEYIDNWSLWLDFKILIRTIPVVVLGTGAK